MPNWCSNGTTFRHNDPKMIAALADRFRDENGNPFAFLRPQPDPLPKAEQSFITAVGDNGERRQIETTLPDWYQWRLNHWGTKWEPSSCDILEQSETELTVKFDTAWGPPIALYDYLQDNGWEIESDYSEPGMCFEGRYSNGFNESWDMEDEDAA